MRGSLTDAAIDFSRYFMPERLTPLFHTAVYVRLSLAQRRHYNQLQACYLNEQTIFFESEMARAILTRHASRPLPGNLARDLRTFLTEEARHSEMFRALNRRCRPTDCAWGDFHFVRVPAGVRLGLRLWLRRAEAFPLFLWLLLLQEERALYYAKEFVSSADELEPNFVAAQRRHLADEVGHVGWDEELLDCIWPETTPPWRRTNAWIFVRLMGEYFTAPKRSGLRVARALVEAFPELQPRWPELRTGLLGLAKSPAWHGVSYSREVTPRAFGRFDRWAEFRDLGRALLCYRPEPVGAEVRAASIGVAASSAR